MYSRSLVRESKSRLRLARSVITREEQADTTLYSGPLGVYIEVSKYYDFDKFGVAPGDFIWTNQFQHEMAVCVGINGQDPYVLKESDLRHIAPLYGKDQKRYPEEKIFRVPSEEQIVAQESKNKGLEKIKVTQAVLDSLIQIFGDNRDFIQEALDLNELPELDVIAEAETIEEADLEYLEHEDHLYDQERAAAFRRWVELIDNKPEVLDLYQRICCDCCETEEMLCIRKMAVILTQEAPQGI